MTDTVKPYDVLLIDGKHALYRAIDANPDLTSGAMATGAVYGFLTILCSVQRKFGGHVTICWDDWVSGPAHRKAIFPDYKKKAPSPSAIVDQRAEMLKSMHAQQHVLMKLLEDFGIFQSYSPGWEADDVIGTMAKRLDAIFQRVGILSGDRDLLQCVTESVNLLRPRPKGEFLIETPATVEAEWAVKPENFVELKALMGDAGDNIPGCAGIGKVQGARILAHTVTAESAIARAQSEATWPMSEGLRAKISLGAEDIRMSHKLSSINCGVPLKFRARTPDKKRALDQMVKLKFKSILLSGRFDQLMSMGA